jgi:hypothetical protein
MSMTMKLTLTCIGVFFGGTYSYYQAHLDAIINGHYWLALVMAGLAPLVSYFVGLSQQAPWSPPTLPTTTIKTTETITDPPPTAPKPNVTATTEITKP